MVRDGDVTKESSGSQANPAAAAPTPPETSSSTVATTESPVDTPSPELKYGWGQFRPYDPIWRLAHNRADLAPTVETTARPARPVSEEDPELYDWQDYNPGPHNSKKIKPFRGPLANAQPTRPVQSRLWDREVMNTLFTPVTEESRMDFVSSEDSMSLFDRWRQTLARHPHMPLNSTLPDLRASDPVVPDEATMSGDVESFIPEGSQVQTPSSSARDECKICLDADVNAVLIPCGHLAFCFECAQMCKKPPCICPICRRDIEEVFKTYKS